MSGPWCDAPEALTPDEACAAASACDLYADEFCSDDQAEADKSGTFGPRERELLASAARKLAADGVPNFHSPDCACDHEWCATRRALRASQAAVAVALVVGTSEIVGDAIEQDVWEQLHERGLIATARDEIGEGHTFATADGIAWLTDLLARAANSQEEQS